MLFDIILYFMTASESSDEDLASVCLMGPTEKASSLS
jgi:hypothetical protein